MNLLLVDSVLLMHSIFIRWRLISKRILASICFFPFRYQVSCIHLSFFHEFTYPSRIYLGNIKLNW